MTNLTDILKTLCKNLNIELLYTNNKITVLSCNYNDNHSSIRAHKIFKKCDEATAYAIINYYAKTEKREENLRIIKDYADKNFSSEVYKIALPDNEFCSRILKSTEPLSLKQNKNTQLVELTISSITKKEFSGDLCTTNANESLKVKNGDILEVDITVDPFNT